MSRKQQLHLPDGNFITYAQRKGDTNKPGIILCCGFLSSLNSNKAVFLDEYAAKHNLSYVRFDYIGHPESSGSMDDFSISLWKQNTLDVLDKLTTGPQILVGSSIGGWMSILATIERPQRVHALITIAGAADMLIQRFDDPELYEKYNKDEYGLGDKYAPCSPFFRERLDDARLNSVFAYDKIPISCHVRLLHGMKDVVIPYQNSIKVAERLESEDVMVRLCKGSDHRMSEPSDLHLLADELDQILAS